MMDDPPCMRGQGGGCGKPGRSWLSNRERPGWHHAFLYRRWPVFLAVIIADSGPVVISDLIGVAARGRFPARTDSQY
jgi:hypothetical protein